MKKYMPYIILFIIVSIIASLCKILGVSYADLILNIGFVIQIVIILIVVYIYINRNKNKS